LAIHGRKVAQEIGHGLEPPRMGRQQKVVDPALGLAREYRDAERERLLNLRRVLGQHREATAHVEAADGDLHSRGAKLACDVECLGETGSSGRRPGTRFRRSHVAAKPPHDPSDLDDADVVSSRAVTSI
jgi:hypothetical protein